MWADTLVSKKELLKVATWETLLVPETDDKLDDSSMVGNSALRWEQLKDATSDGTLAAMSGTSSDLESEEMFQ